MVQFSIKVATDAELIFGGGIERLLPAFKGIPPEFKRVGASQWERVADRWFARGLRGVSSESLVSVIT